MNIQQALHAVLARQDLSLAQMRAVMRAILSGQVSDAQLAGFLVALRCKGETVDEITAAAEVLRELADKVDIHGAHIIDTCGTGGDGANTFNISTTTAFVVAAAGGQVAKHGNRSVSSRCGSADVLEAAGVNLNLSASQVAGCVNALGVGFLFAPQHHSAMRHTSQVRKEMGIRTLFNLLGPLVNPANARNQLVGVFAKDWLQPIAQVLQKLGSQHVLVVHADDGLDELSIASPSTVVELHDGHISTYTVTPEQFGLSRSSLASLAVVDVTDSLAMVTAVLENHAGPALDIVLLNSGAALYAANVANSIEQGIFQARQAIASGAARDKLNDLVALTQHYAKA